MGFNICMLHTEYSLLDGLIRSKEYVIREVNELGMDSAAITTDYHGKDVWLY